VACFPDYSRSLSSRYAQHIYFAVSRAYVSRQPEQTILLEQRHASLSAYAAQQRFIPSSLLNLAANRWGLIIIPDAAFCLMSPLFHQAKALTGAAFSLGGDTHPSGG